MGLIKGLVGRALLGEDPWFEDGAAEGCFTKVAELVEFDFVLVSDVLVR